MKMNNVILTACMEENYCVYIHKKRCDGEVFYVGIGLPQRPYDKKKRSRFWKLVVSKYDYDIEILHYNLSWESARDIEIQLIKEYGRRDLGEGTLVNLTNGGEGAYGRIPSLDHKNKVSKKLKKFRHDNPQLNKRYVHNQDVRNKISNSLRLYFSNGGSSSFLGKKHSEETKLKISEKLKMINFGDNHPRCKLSKEDVEYIKNNYIKGDKVYGVIGMGKKFNISKGQISKIVNGQRWIS